MEKKKNLEDKLYAEGFVKGAVTEEINRKRRKVLPNSYVLMKFDENGRKEVDFLLGFWISSPYFYRKIENKSDIKFYAVDIEHQIAEKLMLPEEKRAKSFDRLFVLAYNQGYRYNELAEIEAEIIKDCVRDVKKLNKWWEQIKNSGYIFGSPEIKRGKQKFFNELKKKLKL